MLIEPAACAKSLQGVNGPKRFRRNEFHSKLPNLSVGQGAHFPFVILSAIELQLAAQQFVDGKCVFLVPSNLAELAKVENRDVVGESGRLMTEGRALAGALGMKRNSVTKLIGKLDVRLCAMLATKSK